jgi:hypothetical protein
VVTKRARRRADVVALWWKGRRRQAAEASLVQVLGDREDEGVPTGVLGAGSFKGGWADLGGILAVGGPRKLLL